jgi:hypothetical protein
MKYVLNSNKLGKTSDAFENVMAFKTVLESIEMALEKTEDEEEGDLPSSVYLILQFVSVVERETDCFLG